MAYHKKFKNISFRVKDPQDNEFVPIVKKTNDATVCVISFPTLSIGMYKVNVYKNNLLKNKPNELLNYGNCFAFNLNKERWHMDLIYWSLESIELIMELRMHHSIASQIIAQAHLLSTINNTINPFVVIQCHPNILPDKTCKFNFSPPQFGSYEIHFYLNNTPAPEPRPKVHVINSTKWKLIHSFTTDQCVTSLQKKASFIFELCGAPSEFLKAWVLCPDRSQVDMLLYGEEKHNKIGQLRCDFIPTMIGHHSLVACYQDVMFDKCPLEFHAYDSNIVEIVSITPDIESGKSPMVGEALTITYNCQNSTHDEIEVTAIASEDCGIYSPVPVEKSISNKKGIVTFKIFLPIPGQYLIEGFYLKEKINSFEMKISTASDLNRKNFEEDNYPVLNNCELMKVESHEEIMATKTPMQNSHILLTDDLFHVVPVVSGEGLVEAVVGQCAVFVVDPQGETGKLTVDVIGSQSLAKCLIKPESSYGRYEVEYEPKEIGKYEITILWNDHPLPASPFTVDVTDPDSIQCISHADIFNEILRIFNGRKTRIDFSYSLAGKGRMSAFVKRHNDNSNIKSWTTVTKTIWTFWVQSLEEGSFDIEVFWNSRLLGIINVHCESSDGLSPEITDDPVSQIILKGKGLKGAYVGQIAKFTVDTFNVGHGRLVLNLQAESGVMETIPVILERKPDGTYECSYQPINTGKYLLHVAWGDINVKGSPFPINVWSKNPCSDIKCSGDGLTHGLVGEINSITIDTSEVIDKLLNKTHDILSASLIGPDEISNTYPIIKESDKIYRVDLETATVGRHQLNIMYDDTHVVGSPFYPFFTNKESLDKLIVCGPGLESGQLNNYQSFFTVDTREAGVGKLRVQVKGPKEAFRVEVQKISTNNRLIKYSYNPTEAGQYTISINWSGWPIKGSPFQIYLN